MPPEVLERERDAHTAAVEVMSQLLGVVDNDVLVEAKERDRQAALFAAAHMLADAWRAMASLPRLNADNTIALLQSLAKRVL